MKSKVISQIQSVRVMVHQLFDTKLSILNDEQSEDVKHILSALDSMEQLTPILDTKPKTDTERMQILHDLTSPINGIVGYLYILEQEYNAPLTEIQHQLIKSIEDKTQQLYQYISTQLLSPQTDT
jgi:K+-sensing histidine kinase KdpD